MPRNFEKYLASEPNVPPPDKDRLTDFLQLQNTRTMRNQLLRNANSLKTNCFGNRSAGLIRSTLASSINSKSPTQRTLPSIAATMPREISQPAIWHLAANALCDQPRCARNCRTCGPTMFFRVGIVRIFRLDPTNQFPLNCLGFQTSCFVSDKLLLRPRETKSMKMIASNKTSGWVILTTLLCALAHPTLAVNIFFLDDGNLTVFDGTASRLASAGPKKIAAKGPYHHLFDWKEAPGVTRFLISKGRDARFRPDSDAPSGFDLWLRDGNGGERQIHPSVYRARFSPDGLTLAYSTSDCELRIEGPKAAILHTLRGAYNPHWKVDGRTVVFEKAPDGRNLHLPETLYLAKLDVATGKVDLLTDGAFDDVRPEFHPGGKWILFVSGERSGLASFWKISVEGGKPEQVTNVGLKQLDETFVPTPYQQTIWSADGRWFIYDFKRDDTRQIWGLEFDDNGKFLRALKLVEGLNPQWLEDGKTFAYERQRGDKSEPAVGRLP